MGKSMVATMTMATPKKKALHFVSSDSEFVYKFEMFETRLCDIFSFIYAYIYIHVRVTRWLILISIYALFLFSYFFHLEWYSISIE